jgi:L-aspartate oxidase
MKYFDVVIIGSGIAGLSYAIKLSDYFTQHYPDFRICVVTKGDEEESNTKYAQGGVAVVSDFIKDSYEQHIFDTIKAGDDLCDPEVVENVVRDGPARIQEIIDWGAQFDTNETGGFDLGKEGGHSVSRVLHHKDLTGLEIEKKLLLKIHSSPNIEVLNYHFAIDLITQHHLGIELPKFSPDIECYGVYVMNQITRQIDKIVSKVTVIATGGVCQVYDVTTNPSIATGDGIAMAYRAGARVENMEFIQFHPTGLYNPGERPTFLISEAVRGFGGILKTRNGEEFMNKYDDRGSLASRDIVARASDTEMKKRGDESVFLDCRHIPVDSFSERFPRIYEKCVKLGIDISKDMIPVVPVAHYICGGIKVNRKGKSTIKNLYAIGECARTGLHGANRLASNSLLEALVFAHNAFIDTIKKINKLEFKTALPEWNAEGTTTPREMVLITHKLKELRVLMTDYVSIVRTDKRLYEALTRLNILADETETLYNMETLSPQICELRNMICVSELIIKAALSRKENMGLHYNIDNIRKENQGE